MNELEQLKTMTTVVADTGDIDEIARVKPTEATTNPSLILKAAGIPKYAGMVERVKASGGPAALKIDELLVEFGSAILTHIPGRVSTEVDARLSFDTAATVQKAKRVITLYELKGIPRSRVLIKIAATWEGIQAACLLEAEGIHTNITLIFSEAQAVAAAQAGATLISPFVGRIYDFYKKKAGSDWDEAANAGANDPGVMSVKKIFAALKGMGSKTQVMGASFRNKGEILALAGCDLLTIAPKFIDELSNGQTHVARALDPALVAPVLLPELTQEAFLKALDEDPMASEKLRTGIESFVADTEKLEAILA